MKSWKTTLHGTGAQKKAGVAILISNKVDFNPKRQRSSLHTGKAKNSVERDNNYKFLSPNIGTLSFVKQKLLEIRGLTDTNRIIVVGFNTGLSQIDRSTKQKCKKKHQSWHIIE